MTDNLHAASFGNDPAELVARLYQAMNSGDPAQIEDVVANVLAPGWVNEPAAPGQAPGADSFRALVPWMRRWSKPGTFTTLSIMFAPKRFICIFRSRSTTCVRKTRFKGRQKELDTLRGGYVHVRRFFDKKTKGLPHPLSATVAPFRAWRGSRCAVGRPTRKLAFGFQPSAPPRDCRPSRQVRPGPTSSSVSS